MEGTSPSPAINLDERERASPNLGRNVLQERQGALPMGLVAVACCFASTMGQPVRSKAYYYNYLPYYKVPISLSRFSQIPAVR